MGTGWASMARLTAMGQMDMHRHQPQLKNPLWMGPRLKTLRAPAVSYYKNINRKYLHFLPKMDWKSVGAI